MYAQQFSPKASSFARPHSFGENFVSEGLSDNEKQNSLVMRQILNSLSTYSTSTISYYVTCRVLCKSVTTVEHSCPSLFVSTSYFHSVQQRLTAE